VRNRALACVAAWRALALAGALALAPASGHAATSDDPDWPCIQRLVPAIAPGMIWPGPPVDSVPGEWTDDVATQSLAAELAARRTPLEDFPALVEGYAAGLDPAERNNRLTLLFEGALEIINNDRASLIAGIKRFTRGQRVRAEGIRETSETIAAAVQGADLPEGVTIDDLRLVRDWETRIFDERERSITYLCEQPVLLEQRAFAIAREIAGHLE
jgi:hypothetical protein